MADSTDNSTGATPQGNNTTGQNYQGFSGVIGYMKENKIAALLFMTRLFTIISSIAFIVPIFGFNPYSCYQRALLSNAATSALRLHQRLPNVQFNREFFAMLFMEDSAHHLFYSLVFITGSPNTMALVPIFLFSLLRITPYTKTLLDILGPNSMGLVRKLIAKIEEQSRNILRFIACNEIFLMPAIIVMIFIGHSSLLLPFVYYRYLSLRYTSRRNPYCRQLFYELRITAEQMVANPSCPEFVRGVVYKAIGFIIRLSPQVPAA